MPSPELVVQATEFVRLHHDMSFRDAQKNDSMYLAKANSYLIYCDAQMHTSCSNLKLDENNVCINHDPRVETRCKNYLNVKDDLLD